MRMAREWAPIFRITWPRCAFTVISLTPNAAAISLAGGDKSHHLALGQSLDIPPQPIGRSVALERVRSRSIASWIASSSS